MRALRSEFEPWLRHRIQGASPRGALERSREEIMSQPQEGADRLPPHNRDAERSVLGAMLRDNKIIPDVINVLGGRFEDFYVFAHQKIYESITGLFDKHKAADPVTLANDLNEKQLIQDIGGYGYLVELWEAAPSAANAAHYAGIVRQKAIIRNLIHACNELQRDAYDQVMPANELLDSAERRVLEIAESGVTGSTTTLQDAIFEAYDRINTRKGDHQDYSGVPTGFVDLDSLTAGLQDSELVIIAARPSVGKTSLALNLLRHVVVEEKMPAFFVSLEQSRIEIAERLLCSQARVDSHRLRKGTLSSDEMAQLMDGGQVLTQAPLFIDDIPGQNLLRIAANARRLKVRHQIRMVV